MAVCAGGGRHVRRVRAREGGGRGRRGKESRTPSDGELIPFEEVRSSQSREPGAAS